MGWWAGEASLPGTTMLRPSGQLMPSLDLEEWRTVSWWGNQEEGRPRREGGPVPLPSYLGDTSQAAQRTEELCPQLETGGPEPRQAGWGCSSTRSDTALPSANAVPWSVVGRPWRLSGEKKSACHCRKRRFNP